MQKFYALKFYTMKKFAYIITIIFVWVSLGFSQINRVIWFQYSSTGCLTCHKTSILRMNDSTYILGSLHYNSGLRPMLMQIKVKQGITIQWYKAFTSNPSLNLDVSDIIRINDTLIAVSGGHGGCGSGTNCSFVGLFNINTQNFLWAKYFSSKGIASGLAYDGNSILVAVHGYNASGYGAIVKFDLNGNVIWAKQTHFGCSRNDNYSIIPEQNGYVVMGVGWWCGNWQPVIYRISLDGSSATLIRGISNNYRAYKLIKDIDGNYVIIGFYEPDHAAYLAKIAPNGNILYSKRYTSNSDLRFYYITSDLDNHYLVSGVVQISGTTYPMVAKINKDNGSIIYSRYWPNAPAGQAHNQGKGIAPVKLGKILASGYLGSSVDSHNGFIAILDSIDCMNSFNISVSDYSLGTWSPGISLSDYSGINNLTLTSYNFSLSQTPSCSIQGVSDNEYKSCNFKIYGSKGFIGVESNKEIVVSIYNVNGYKVKEVSIKSGKIPLKSGIYIVKVNGEHLKLVVR